MQHQRCVCPQCGTTLRVKDRAYFNRPVPCPDCRTPVVIAPRDDDRLEVRLADPPAEPASKSRSLAAPFAAAVSRTQNWAPNVVVVSWAAALLVALLIAGVAFWPKSSRRSAITNVTVEQDRPDQPIDDDQPQVQGEPPAVDDPPVMPIDNETADVPIEPLLSPEPEPVADEFPPADAALAAATADLPPQPPPKPVVVIDFDAALAQPLLEFRQDRSISRRDLLDLIEEMLGAPIRYDREELGDAAAMLDRPISLELQQPTVGDVLAKVLEGTELTPHREPDGLRLKKASDAPGP